MFRKENKTVKNRKRSAEILAVFAKHNFYMNGFTPQELKTTLEDLGPTYVKIGQIMSSRTDLLPEEYCRELEKLRSDVVPLDASTVRNVIEKETGKKIDEIYEEFSDVPLGAASIAQAHFGILKDGTKVVTKVQRPDIDTMMREDFILLKKKAKNVSRTSEDDSAGVVDLTSVLDELEKVTEEELNYNTEAENTRKFRELCIEDETKVSCPAIINELTTEKILTMTYVDGYSIARTDRIDADGYSREEIGKALIESYLHQVLDVGMFHGDPHQGNIMISGGIPYWIDFGMVGHVSENCITQLQDVIFSIVQRDIDGLADAALAIGKINGKINRTRFMEDLDELVTKYISYKKVTDIDVGELMEDLIAVMKEYNITVDKEYTMLIRSLVTFEGVIESFCPEQELFDFLVSKMITRARENFDINEKITSAVQALAATGLRTAKMPSMVFDVLQNLVKGRIKINLELSGYDNMITGLNRTLTYLILAVFSCVLFSGSCTLCTTDIHPQVGGVPLAAMVGFIVSISLGFYTIREIIDKK